MENCPIWQHCSWAEKVQVGCAIISFGPNEWQAWDSFRQSKENIELAEEQSIALIEEAQLMEEECNKVKYRLGESGSSLKRQEKRSRLMN